MITFIYLLHIYLSDTLYLNRVAKSEEAVVCIIDVPIRYGNGSWRSGKSQYFPYSFPTPTPSFQWRMPIMQIDFSVHHPPFYVEFFLLFILRFRFLVKQLWFMCSTLNNNFVRLATPSHFISLDIWNEKYLSVSRYKNSFQTLNNSDVTFAYMILAGISMSNVPFSTFNININSCTIPYGYYIC